jgi:hypothetical protein
VRGEHRRHGVGVQVVEPDAERVEQDSNEKEAAAK